MLHTSVKVSYVEIFEIHSFPRHVFERMVPCNIFLDQSILLFHFYKLHVYDWKKIYTFARKNQIWRNKKYHKYTEKTQIENTQGKFVLNEHFYEKFQLKKNTRKIFSDIFLNCRHMRYGSKFPLDLLDVEIFTGVFRRCIFCVSTIYVGKC